MSEFCRQHAYYNCPVCKGESLDWIIPIVEGSDISGQGGDVVGTVVVTPDGTTTFTRDESIISVPYMRPAIRVAGPSGGTPEAQTTEAISAPALKPEPRRRPTPTQVAEVASLFQSSILDEPWMVEAAARGRKVYERACELAEELGITVAEALPKAAEELA